MLFLFNYFFLIHNNNGGFMKKILFLFLFLIFFDVKALGVVYISKKDIDTNEFISDCDFMLYDSTGNIVDSWVQNNDVHVASIPVGSYKLVERPKVMDSFNDGLSKSYDINIDNDDIFEFILYNNKIATPRNLNYNFHFLYGFAFLILGLFFIVVSRKNNYI